MFLYCPSCDRAPRPVGPSGDWTCLCGETSAWLPPGDAPLQVWLFNGIWEGYVEVSRSGEITVDFRSLQAGNSLRLDGGTRVPPGDLLALLAASKVLES